MLHCKTLIPFVQVDVHERLACDGVLAESDGVCTVRVPLNKVLNEPQLAPVIRNIALMSDDFFRKLSLSAATLTLYTVDSCIGNALRASSTQAAPAAWTPEELRQVVPVATVEQIKNAATVKDSAMWQPSDLHWKTEADLEKRLMEIFYTLTTKVAHERRGGRPTLHKLDAGLCKIIQPFVELTLYVHSCLSISHPL